MKFLFSLLLLFFVLWASLYGEITEIVLFGEDELVVTPTRMEESVLEAPSSVTVITYEMLRRMGVRTLGEALQMLPGVYVCSSERHLKRLWIRGIKGTYNDHTLLLINGIPQRELVYGHMFIDEYLPVNNIKRIEIIRGPGSALYGTNAFSGVINVITKDAEDVRGTLAEGVVGSANTYGGSCEYGDVLRGFSVYAYGRFYSTEGSGPEFSSDGKRRLFATDPVRSAVVWFTGRHEGWRLSLRYINFRHKFPTLPDYPAEVWENNWFFYDNYFVDLSRTFSVRNVTARVYGYLHEYDNTAFWQMYDVDTSGAGALDYVITYDIWPVKRTRLGGLSFNANIDSLPLQQTVTFGMEYIYERIIEVRDLYRNRITGDTISPYADTSQSPYDFYIESMVHYSYAAYFQDVIRLHFCQVTIGVRDDYSIYGHSVSPRGGIIYHIVPGIVAKLLYGRAFRAPSYRELYTYSPNPNWARGNSKLRPEIISTYEFEVNWDPSPHIRWRTNVYLSDVKDLICREPNVALNGDTVAMYTNSDEQLHIYGAEAMLKWAFPWTVGFGNFTYTYVKEEEHRYDYPVYMANLSLTAIPTMGVSITTNFRYVGERKRRDDNAREPVGDYLVCDVVLSVISGSFFGECGVHNVFDVDYYNADFKDADNCDIKGEGRTLLLNVGYKLW